MLGAVRYLRDTSFIKISLTEKTGLSERQIKSYRLNLWIEGVHFKHLTALGETDNSKVLLWYNYPKINQLVQDA
ncbi:excisionase family protein [Citrobacter cronae]|uniref:excisionase family protein n=1 Tax=Citrobacter cronae TaxID=1748967 RepID=UPI0034E37F9C